MRVSTLEQNLDLQLQALKKAGCRRTFREKISAGNRNRPEFQRMLDQIRAGDTIVVWKLDRLARSTRDLLETMETIQQAGGKFQSYRSHGPIRPRTGENDHTHFCRESRSLNAA
jgi:DNA invertase Pin-like site-specific DNA recombinase